MANLKKLFGTDRRAEVEGVWIDFGAFKLKLARAGGSNEAFERVSAEKWKPYLREIELGVKDKKRDDRLSAELYAETVILDWQDVEDDDGKPIPYTPERGAAMLLELPDFFDRVVREAKRLKTFQAAERETAAGN